VPGLESKRLGAGVLMAMAVFVPASFLPIYTCINQSEGYILEQLDKQPSYSRVTCLSYRDAHFAKRQLSEADRWEWSVPVRAPEYMILEGSVNLINGGMHSDALTSLSRAVISHPFWLSPRQKIAELYISMGRFDEAQVHIDTLLQLAPYNRSVMVLDYSYYRNAGQTALALSTAEHALDYSPFDHNIRTDLMLMRFRIGNMPYADSMAQVLISEDSTLAYPYLIKGLLALRQTNNISAIDNFEKFIVLAPDSPELPQVQAFVDSLQVLPPSE
jgi:tetratricopeptide (TPR) repeat protein